MTTYKLTLDNCQSNPKVIAEFDSVPESVLENVINTAKFAFRSIEVVSNETGEVVLTHYVGLQLFKPLFECGEAIDIISRYCQDEQ